MACYHPVTGYMSRSLTKNGKRQIKFTPKGAFVDMPITIPCGSCIGCRIDHSRQWAIRCVHESKLHDTSCFITLTYNEENLPEGGTLVRKDVQDFLKRLRKHYGSFRYFGSGEYGDQLSRPHYHLIIFGLDFSEDRKKHSTNKRGDTTYVSKTLTRIWGLGHTLIGGFNYQTAAYTARYVIKKYKGREPDRHYQRVSPLTGEVFDLVPEFSMMSLKPGIGSGWFEKYSTDVFPSDEIIHQGKKHSVPKFYMNKLQKENPEMYKKIREKRKRALIHNPNNSPERLEARELVKKSQIGMLKRSL